MTDDRFQTDPVDVRTTSSSEYELVAVATTTVDGPAGKLSVRRRYEALPYHNDVVYPDGANSDDEFVDRPDAVHAHTTCSVVDGGDEEYLLDEHDTWRPDDPRVLEAPDRFGSLCRRRLRSDLDDLYARARSRLAERGE